MSTLKDLGAVPFTPAQMHGHAVGFPLFRRGGGVRAYVMVEIGDYYLLSQSRWFLSGAEGDDHRYAARYESHHGRNRIVFMHRELLGLPAGGGAHMRGPYVDHINRNTLDNRRANLRIVTPGENAQNRGSWGRLGFRGVSETRQGRFMARGGAGGKVRLGTYDTPEEAAEVARLWREGALAFATD